MKTMRSLRIRAWLSLRLFWTRLRLWWPSLRAVKLRLRDMLKVDQPSDPERIQIMMVGKDEKACDEGFVVVRAYLRQEGTPWADSLVLWTSN